MMPSEVTEKPLTELELYFLFYICLGGYIL